MIPAETVIFAGPADDEGIQNAKDWLAAQKFTPDDVRLIKRDGQCLIIAKRDVSPKLLS